MPTSYLTKSDFKTCSDCRTKLFYRKNRYPSTQEDNDYLRFLADGGFMIEAIARAQYPTGIDLSGERDPQRAAARTRALLDADPHAVIFEAAVLAGKFYVRVDILRREGEALHVIEVKSSSLKAQANEDDEPNAAHSPFIATAGRTPGQVVAKWRPYLTDLAFQVRVVRAAFPSFTIRPCLCVVDGDHRATAHETLAHFQLSHDLHDAKARPTVTCLGDLAHLRGSGLLVFREVTAEIALLMPDVIARSDALAALLGPRGEVTRVQEPVADHYAVCRKCEYRFRPDSAPPQHGFAECWGPLATVHPHILDLHRVGQIGSSTVPDPVPGLVAAGRASLLDLTADQLGKDGVRQKRRLLQWTHSHPPGSEHLPAALRRELACHEQKPGWPLHFLDFEACNVVLPHHAGLRPYERVAFQWSCHRLDQAGTFTHAEWLNTERDFPNFAFARSLREHLGETGTIYVWSPYEQSTLRRVLLQIEEWVRLDPAAALRVSGLRDLDELHSLVAWIDRTLGPEDANGKRPHSPRIRDLHALALAHYFHPAMLGRTSIKVFLPAIWRHSPELRVHPWFVEYLKFGPDGQPLDPYKTLPKLPLGEEDDSDDAITDGTGAIRVYQDLIFRSETDPKFRANREKLLKQYCRLDTAAMMIGWSHWRGLARRGLGNFLPSSAT